MILTIPNGKKDGSHNPGRDDYFSLIALAALFEGNVSIDWVVELTANKTSNILLAFEKGIQQGWLISNKPGIYRFVDFEKRRELLDSFSPDEKARLHQQIADILLKDPMDDETKAQVLSHHLFHISNDLEKSRWMIRAGDFHLKAYQTVEAFKCYKKVLDDYADISGEEAEDRLFAEVAIKYSKISTARHNPSEVISILRKAMARTERWNDQNIQALLEMHIAKNEWLCSRYHSALRHFEKGWSTVKKINNPELLRSSTIFGTFFLYWQGRFREIVSIYEKSVPDVEKHPHDRFPLLAALLVGRCYAQIGQVTQGMGMMDGILKHCREKGDQYLSAHAGAAIGFIMLDIRHIDEALKYLQRSVKEAGQEHCGWIRIMGKLALAYAFYLNGDNRRSIDCLREYLAFGEQIRLAVRPYPYLMDLCWATEQGKYPRITGISLNKELNCMIRGKNVYMKGIAYKYRALLQKKQNLSDQSVLRSFKLSVKWLKESGHQIELARTELALARHYLSLGLKEEAKKMTLAASKLFSSYSERLVPNDLRSLITKSPNRKTLLTEILKMGQEVAVIRDNKSLVQYIISTINRVTGAERGAIFLLDDNSCPLRFRLRASKNLTSEQIAHPSFSSSMKMIEEAALAGRGSVQTTNSAENSDSSSSEAIRSRICVPMILKHKVIGVFYHDNRLLSGAFKKSELEIVSYFAAMAAFAMDNAKAYEEIQLLNQKLKDEKLYYQEQNLQEFHDKEIVGESPAIKQMLNKIAQVSDTDTTVLISGETGVGKELVARAIHRARSRRDKAFIGVNCSALPDTLISSELFGHERGAFTGAISRRIGRFELANGGTLFLDEIGTLPLETQVRLLRVLQTKSFERVGGNETLHSNFRLIAATNLDLREEIKAHRFRADLYYRLNVFPAYVPSLRERKEDIPLLAYYFLKTFGAKAGKTFKGIKAADMERLIQYNWPGNVRELENIMERSVLLSSGADFRIPELTISDLPNSPDLQDGVTLLDNERRHILWALQKTNWKIRGPGGAAELLDIHPSTLRFRMNKLGIQRPTSVSN